jgi:hypothetical protein
MGLDGLELEPVFSPLGEERFARGVELVYEGYLAHYGTPRSLLQDDVDGGLLSGDELYAHGLALVAALGEPAAVSDLADLLARCAELRAAGADGDGEVWAAAVALLGSSPLRGRDDPAELARAAAGSDAVERALAAHAERTIR